MPPKKKVAANGEDDSVALSSVDDFNLPRSMVQRLAKGVLPANTQIQKDALTALLKSTTVFVSYLASNANDRAVLGNHKTIKPEDVMDALRDLEFEDFVPRVRAEHDRFVEIQNNKRNDYRRRIKEDHQTEGKSDTKNANNSTHADGVEPRANQARGRNGDQPPAAKKPRISFANAEAVQSNDEAGEDAASDEEDADATELEDDEEGDEMDEDELEDEEADGLEEPVETYQASDNEDNNHYQRDPDEDSDDEEEDDD